MITGAGTRSRTTVRSGIPPRLHPAGRPTATVTGATSARGDGPGWTLHPGVLHPTTTVVGHLSAAAGAGAQVLILLIPFVAPRLWASSVEDSALGLAGALVAALAGSRAVRTSLSIPGTTRAACTTATSTTEIQYSAIPAS